jgi:ParB family chromosome partitioning protein
VELRTLSDKEALIAMDSENRLRKDISPYERALSYASWIRAGHFNSQDEISRTLKISASQVSRVLRMAQLPTVIVKAFADPTQIREAWAARLLERLDNPSSQKSLLDTARTLIATHERLPANEVYRRLLAASPKGKKLAQYRQDVVVLGDTGAPLFRIRQQRESVAILVPLHMVAEQTLRDISEAVGRILQAANVQAIDSTPITSVPTQQARKGEPSLDPVQQV